MKEQELIEYFESRRGDTSNWSDRPVKAVVRRGGMVVFSLRLPADELERLRRRAESEGTTVSDLIRWATQIAVGRQSRSPTMTLWDVSQDRPNQIVNLVIDASFGSRSRGTAQLLPDSPARSDAFEGMPTSVSTVVAGA